MDRAPGTGSRLQALLIGLYATLGGRALRRSAVGRWLFERAYIFYKVAFEAGEIDQLAAHIRPGTWAIDVGANIGFFTLRFAHTVTDGGRVIAIEPDVDNFAALTRRIAAAGLQDRVVARQAAAAERSGALRLQINPDHPGDHRLAATGVPVAGLTLDELVDGCGSPPVSLIKIDVQGAERRVLAGASRLLARRRPALFVEMDDAALRRQGTSAVDLLDWLRALDYVPHRLVRGSGPQPITRDEIFAGRAYVDVLFLPAERERRAGPPRG